MGAGVERGTSHAALMLEFMDRVLPMQKGFGDRSTTQSSVYQTTEISENLRGTDQQLRQDPAAAYISPSGLRQNLSTRRPWQLHG
jgi:hypothetical protein